MARSPRRIVRSLLAISALSLMFMAGCPEDGDSLGDSQPPGRDAHASAPADAAAPDAAQPDIDATVDTDGALDARVDLDGSFDTGMLDAAWWCFAPAASSCAPRGAPSVRCVFETCSGATPVCCGGHPQQPETFYCAAREQDCFDAGAFYLTVATCDDANDCAEDEVCGDYSNRGHLLYSGGRCEPSCTPPRFGHVRTAQCTKDCECGDRRCIDGCCGGCSLGRRSPPLPEGGV